MKKGNSLILAALALFAVLFVSCDSDSGDEPTPSKLSAEEHKSKINDIGIAFINDMDDMSSESMIEVLNNFFQLADENDLESEVSLKSAPMAYMRQYTSLKSKPLNALALKSIDADDYESFTEIYNDLTGEYTFNASSSTWSKTAHATEIIFNFPSEESKTVNDAQLRVYDYSAQTSTLQEFDDFIYEQLNSVKIDLKVNSDVLFSYHFSGTYHNDGLPKLINYDVTMESYAWNYTMDLSNPGSEFKLSSKYSKGSTTILQSGFTAKGNFTYANIESDVIDRENDDEEDILSDQDILKSGNIYFQIENLRVEGEVDAKAYISDVLLADELPYDTDAEEKASEEAYAKAFNDNVSLYIMYADNKEIIANAEMYVYEEDYSWGSYEDFEYYTDIRFLFTDGTAIDDSYFENGFSSLIDRMNEMIQKMNNEHDLDIDEIEE